MKALILSLVLALSIDGLLAQDDYWNEQAVAPDATDEPPAYFDLGFGLGVDYGGIIGMKVTGSPIPFVSVMGSLGYYLVDLGWNAGIKLNILPKDRKHLFRPGLKFLYGTNSAIFIQNAEHYNQTYLGSTYGLALEFRFGTKRAHGFDIDLNYLIRDPAFYDDLDAIRIDPSIDDVDRPANVQISLGYHVEF